MMRVMNEENGREEEGSVDPVAASYSTRPGPRAYGPVPIPTRLGTTLGLARLTERVPELTYPDHLRACSP